MKKDVITEEVGSVPFGQVLKALDFDKKVFITALIMFFMGRAWLPGGLLPSVLRHLLLW